MQSEDEYIRGIFHNESPKVSIKIFCSIVSKTKEGLRVFFQAHGLSQSSFVCYKSVGESRICMKPVSLDAALDDHVDRTWKIGISIVQTLARTGVFEKTGKQGEEGITLQTLYIRFVFKCVRADLRSWASCRLVRLLQRLSRRSLYSVSLLLIPSS